jgi:predicted ester cyclase
MSETSRTAALDGVSVDANVGSARSLIDQYYSAFNQRRFVDAGSLFAHDAVLDQLPLLRQEPGAIGYLQFVSAWLRAFPDATFIVQQVTTEDRRIFDVKLEASGTHSGALEVGGRVFRATGMHTTLGLREMLEIRDGRIAFSSLIYDMHEVVEKLARLDAAKLVGHIERLRHLAEELKGIAPDSRHGRELTNEIGRELDAARHVVRPYYKR